MIVALAIYLIGWAVLVRIFWITTDGPIWPVAIWMLTWPILIPILLCGGLWDRLRT